MHHVQANKRVVRREKGHAGCVQHGLALCLWGRGCVLTRNTKAPGSQPASHKNCFSLCPSLATPLIVRRWNRRQCRGASLLGCGTTEEPIVELAGMGWTTLRR